MTDAHPTAAPFLPPRLLLPTLIRAAEICSGCDLHHLGTQTVFGEGPAHAEMMLIGEQPGDREDREGRPFVGPAGKLLDRMLERAGISRGSVYLTNVVKHLRWEPGAGERRLHRKPSLVHVRACRPWLDAELAVVRPAVVVCLGATAAAAVAGPSVRVTRDRGSVLQVEGLSASVILTVHPSSILRMEDEQTRHMEEERLVDDLRRAGTCIRERDPGPSVGAHRASGRSTHV